jgi:hypothetical protein
MNWKLTPVFWNEFEIEKGFQVSRNDFTFWVEKEEQAEWLTSLLNSLEISQDRDFAITDDGDLIKVKE